MKNILLVALLMLLFTLSPLVLAQQNSHRIPVVYYRYDSKGNIVKREVKQELDPRGQAHPGYSSNNDKELQ